MKFRITFLRLATPILFSAVLSGTVLAKEPSAARVQELAGWLTPAPIGPAASITNRAAWAALATEHDFSGAINKAAALAKKPIPEQSDELYLDYSRTGNRDHWQKVAFNRRGMVQTFVMAECLENKGRFIAPLEKLIAALCAERTWVYPAHDRGQKNFRGEQVDIDLGSASLGWELACADRLLGDKLSPRTRRLVGQNLERRIFKPFRDSVRETRTGNGWLRVNNNWNAVCLAGVTGAALANLESPRERAWFIAAAEDYIRSFLSGFTPDGYCSEGVGYWNYGFGHFAMLSETVRRSTNGKLDLLTLPSAAKPALFGARTEILAGIYPSIADCSPSSQPSVTLLEFLTNRFDFDVPAHLRDSTKDSAKYICETLTYATAPSNLPQIPARKELNEMPWRTWFPDGGVLISRPGPDATVPFAACVKGGNNDEHHNHNDVGTFMVVSGKRMLICDPGSEVYTARTFSSKRYESKVLSSFGHPVPVIAGKLQRAGSSARGVVLQSRFTPESDTLRLDIRSAYDVPDLQRLEREFRFQRGAAPSLTVTDEIAFSKASTYETALITWGKWQRVSESELLISDGADAVRVRIDSGGLPFEIVSETINEDVHTPTKPVRLGLKLKAPVTKAQFKVTVTSAAAEASAALKK